MIAESMYYACDDSGKMNPMMDSIVDYQNNNKELSVSSQKIVHRGRSFMWRYTVGWQLYVQWRYGLKSWQALKDLEESHTAETADYDVAQEIYNDTALKWWVKAVLKNRLRIISLVRKINSQHLKKTHNFGIEVPRLVA